MTNPLDEPVRSIANHDVISAARADTLRDLAKKMADSRVSALLVEQRTGDLAIVTEHDIVTALANSSDPDADWAVDVMSRDLIEVTPETSIADVAELMQQAGIRHILVRGAGDAPAIVSIRDLLEPILQQ